MHLEKDIFPPVGGHPIHCSTVSNKEKQRQQMSRERTYCPAREHTGLETAPARALLAAIPRPPQLGGPLAATCRLPGETHLGLGVSSEERIQRRQEQHRGPFLSSPVPLSYSVSPGLVKSPGSGHLALCPFILPLRALCISDHLACCTSQGTGLLDVGWSHCPDPLQSLPAYNPSGLGRSSSSY